MRVPYDRIDTVFLDAGNTLLMMDFEFLSHGFRAHGVECDAVSLGRAEAAGRRTLSEFLARGISTEGEATRRFWVENLLRHLPGGAPDAARRELRPLIDWLWSPEVRVGTWTVVPRALPPALARLREAGLKLVVVSNADGNVEKWIRERGLREHLHGVVDSGLLGIEKPHAGIFEHALRLADSEPHETVHIGDLYAVDVAGARAAGCHAVLLDPFDDFHAADCERAPDVAAVAERILGARSRAGRAAGGAS